MIPKVELHLHLEGAAPPDFIRTLAQERNVDLSGIFDAAGSYAYRNFADFLRVYEAACTVLRSPEDFARLTRIVLERSKESGVIYTEAFVSPDFCGNRDPSAWREYLHAIREAALATHGIEMRAIVTCIRHFGPEAAREAALCAAETVCDFLTGFGIAGDESAGHPRDFTYAFDMAREAGLRLTAHAGEWGGATSVRDTLDHLRVERIGHGVRAADDPRLVERLIEDGVTLEVCPGSNVTLGIYPDLPSHPIDDLSKAGVSVTVSTDDPPFFHTDMRQEYARLSQAFHWDESQFRKINRAAAHAAFCDDATRDALLARIATP